MKVSPQTLARAVCGEPRSAVFNADSFENKKELTDNIRDQYKAYCNEMLQELSDFYSNAVLMPSSKSVKLPKSYNVSDYCIPPNAASFRDRYVFCDKCLHVIAVIRGTLAKVHPNYSHHELRGFDGNRDLTFNFSVEEVYFHPHECDIPPSERKGRMMPKSQGGRGWLKVKGYPTDKVINFPTFCNFLAELDETTAGKDKIHAYPIGFHTPGHEKSTYPFDYRYFIRLPVEGNSPLHKEDSDLINHYFKYH